ncbi:MAG: hypothetical protein ACREDF_11880, partial [Thermoplasmata archaeon]
TSCCVINEGGDGRGDGWPDFNVNMATSHGEVTWASNEEGDTEIAYAETTEIGTWTQIFILTSNNFNDLDPKLTFSPATGGTKIVYWRDDASPQVYIIERLSATAGWSSPKRVSGGNEAARYPSSIVAFGKVHVGYELTQAQGKDIIIAGRDDNPMSDSSQFIPEVITHCNYTGKADVRLDGQGGRYWVTWIHSDTQVGFSRFNGTIWEPPQFKTYSAGDDTEAIRFQIRREILSGN